MPAAMVLCAGFGTRLRPLTELFPKPLLPVGDRPAVAHVLEALRIAGLSPLVMNTHHRAQAFDRALPADVTVAHEPTILGTAGGVKNAAALLGPGEVLVWNGDVIAEPDLSELLQSHRASRCGATLLAVPRPPGQGTLGVGPQGAVARLRGERSGPEHAGADFIGIQVISPSWRDRLPAEGCLVGDLYLPALRAGEPINVHLHPGPWDDIGTPRALLEANLRWLDRNHLASWSAEPVCAELRRTVVCRGADVACAGILDECLILPGASVREPATRMIAMPGGRVIQVE